MKIIEIDQQLLDADGNSLETATLPEDQHATAHLPRFAGLISDMPKDNAFSKRR